MNQSAAFLIFRQKSRGEHVLDAFQRSWRQWGLGDLLNGTLLTMANHLIPQSLEGRTGRDCEEFYTRQIELGRVVDDRYIMEGGKAKLIAQDNTQRPYRVFHDAEAEPIDSKNGNAGEGTQIQSVELKGNVGAGNQD